MKARPSGRVPRAGDFAAKKMAWGAGSRRLSRRCGGLRDPDTSRGRPMDHFIYRGGVLHAEDVPLPEIAAAVGTPVYVYSAATLTRHYRVFQEALAGIDHLICYAVKANSNLAVLALMGSLGAGMDVVSEGEYRRAQAAGVPGERIVFSGRRQDPRGDAAGARGRHPAVQRRERARARGAERGGGGAGRGGADRGPGQPGRRRADPRQDRHRQGGEQVRRADRAGARGLCRGGGGCRGSRSSASTSISAASSTELAPYEAAFAQGGGADGGAARRRARASGGSTSAAGSASPTGGANEAPPLPFDYGEVIRRTVGHLGCEIEIEPGRLIAGNAGVLLSAGHLPQARRGAGLPDPRRGDERPGAAGDVRRLARHRAGASSRPPGAETAPVDVVGPVCETGDTFARARELPPLGAGRAGGLPLGGRLRGGDGVGVQLAAAGPGGAGARAITSTWCGRGRALTKC